MEQSKLIQQTAICKADAYNDGVVLIVSVQ